MSPPRLWHNSRLACSPVNFNTARELAAEPQAAVIPIPKLAEGGHRREPQQIFLMDQLLERNKAIDTSNLKNLFCTSACEEKMSSSLSTF